jgi:methionine-rich copper-binding protein CopC
MSQPSAILDPPPRLRTRARRRAVLRRTGRSPMSQVTALLRLLGLALVCAGLAVAARDALAFLRTGDLAPLALGQLWFDLHRSSLNLAQAIVQRYVAAWLWDPVITTLLFLWAAPVLAGLGGTLLVLSRRAAARRPRRRAVAAVFAAAGMLGFAGADAQAMAVLSSVPSIEQAMDGAARSFVVRFDQPVDHATARLVLETADGRRELKARLASRPSVVYAAVGRLVPGDYRLRWEVKDRYGVVHAGAIPFRVTGP